MTLESESLVWSWYKDYAKQSIVSPIKWYAYQGPFPATEITLHQIEDASPFARTFTTEGHGALEISFIETIFKRLDAILEPEFVQVSSSQEADITIFSSRDGLGKDPSTGMQWGGYFSLDPPRVGDIVWRDFSGKAVFSDIEKQIIVHEIGHSLGLGHPDNDGYNPAWTTNESIMSYLDAGVTSPTWFQSLDIQALLSIWGRETSASDLATEATSDSTDITAVDAGPATSGINQELVSLLADQSVVDYQMYADRELSFFIDRKAKSVLDKSLLKQGGHTTISKAEAKFAKTVFAQIDSLTGLSTREVRSPRKADVILGCLSAKTPYGWYTYFDEGYRYADLAFFDKKSNTLGEREKVDIAEVILYAAGLWDYTESSYSTFDTVMSNNGLDYHGLTVNDIAALQSIWGAA